MIKKGDLVKSNFGIGEFTKHAYRLIIDPEGPNAFVLCDQRSTGWMINKGIWGAVQMGRFEIRRGGAYARALMRPNVSAHKLIYHIPAGDNDSMQISVTTVDVLYKGQILEGIPVDWLEVVG